LPQEVPAPLPIIHQKIKLNIKFNPRVKNHNQEKQRDFKGNLPQKNHLLHCLHQQLYGNPPMVSLWADNARKKNNE
jgi:hypothetical protein